VLELGEHSGLVVLVALQALQAVQFLELGKVPVLAED
jgi:hypothetical protein